MTSSEPLPNLLHCLYWAAEEVIFNPTMTKQATHVHAAINLKLQPDLTVSLLVIKDFPNKILVNHKAILMILLAFVKDTLTNWLHMDSDTCMWIF